MVALMRFYWKVAPNYYLCLSRIVLAVAIFSPVHGFSSCHCSPFLR